MNRNQRRGRVLRHNDSLNRFNAMKIRKASGKGAQSTLGELSHGKSVVNRCCYITPDQRDFGQYYGTGVSPNDMDSGLITHRTDQEKTILQDKYGFYPVISDTITELKGLTKVPCSNNFKIKSSSQYADQRSGNAPTYVESDGTKRRNVDNDDVDKLDMNDDIPVIYERPTPTFISDVPHVKIIAEKFSKYKKNNLELRRLDERVVCVEYDVFYQTDEVLKPVQRMRAFFSIKPVLDNDNDGIEKQDAGPLPRLPSNIKNKFDIIDEDLIKLTDNEIEIIDGKMEENKSYLDDLRRILKRKKVIDAKKNKTSLDLKSLYEMAKRDGPNLDCDFSETNLLSKAELQEIKDLILQQCTSSVHGFRRKRIKRTSDGSAMGVSIISESIVAELSREDPKLNIYQ